MKKILSLISIAVLAIAVSCEDKDSGKNNSPYPTQPTISGASSNTCEAGKNDEKTVALTANSTNAVSYQWGELVEVDGVDTVLNIAGETAQIFTATKSGQYYVTAINDKGYGERSLGKDVTIYQCEILPAPSIRAVETNVCPSASIIATSIVANGDTFPATRFEWQYRLLSSEETSYKSLGDTLKSTFTFGTRQFMRDTFYEIRVRALNPSGISEWSQSDTVMLLDCAKVPVLVSDYEGVWDVQEWWLPYGSTENPLEKKAVMTVTALDDTTIEISGWHSLGAGTNKIKATISTVYDSAGLASARIAIPFQKVFPSMVELAETWIAPWDSASFADPCQLAYDSAFVNVPVSTGQAGVNEILTIKLQKNATSKYQPPYTNMTVGYRFPSYVLLSGDKGNCTPLGYAIGTTWIKRKKE